MTEKETIGQLKVKLDDIIKELKFLNYFHALSLYEKMDLQKKQEAEEKQAEKKLLSGPEKFVKDFKISYEDWIIKEKDLP